MRCGLAIIVLLLWHSAYAQTPPVNPLPEGALLPDVGNSVTAPVIPKFKSLFFSTEEISQIRSARGVFEKKSAGRLAEFSSEEQSVIEQVARDVQMQKKSGAAATQERFVYPQFYLESLVFHSPNDWLVWISGRKFTPDRLESGGELWLTSVDEEMVSLQWRPKNLAKVKEVWTKAPNPNIHVDLKEGAVEFSLKPNQTFSSYAMRVVEGKVVPVVIGGSAAIADAAGATIEDVYPEASEYGNTRTDIPEEAPVP